MTNYCNNFGVDYVEYIFFKIIYFKSNKLYCYVNRIKIESFCDLVHHSSLIEGLPIS